jgi:hypothetical protein
MYRMGADAISVTELLPIGNAAVEPARQYRRLRGSPDPGATHVDPEG